MEEGKRTIVEDQRRGIGGGGKGFTSSLEMREE